MYLTTKYRKVKETYFKTNEKCSTLDVFNKIARCEDKDFRKRLRNGMSIEIWSDKTGGQNGVPRT